QPVEVTAATLGGPEWPYLATVHWSAAGLVAVSQTRDQKRTATFLIDPDTGATTELVTDDDPNWVELVPGAGVLIGPPDAPRLVAAADRGGARRLMVGGEPVSPPDVQVRSILDARTERVVVAGNPLADPT